MAATPIPGLIGEPDEQGRRGLACGRCKVRFGLARPYHEGGHVRTVSALGRGLIELGPLPGSDLPRFGIGRGSRLHPERPSARRPIKSPASPPPLFPRRAAGGAAARRPEPVPGLRTFEPRFLVYCPACQRSNLVDVAIIIQAPHDSATMAGELNHPDRGEP
jgi:hypothetical protein